MRKIALCLILFLSSNVRAQTYSSISKDSEIFDFLNKIISTNYQDATLSVNNNIIGPLDTSDFKLAVVRDYFSKADFDFMRQQIKGIQKKKWNHPIGHNKLIKNVPSETSSTIYSFSIPLFSYDRKHAIVIEGFYCGLVCGGTTYYIYALQSDGTWGRLEKYKEWAE